MENKHIKLAEHVDNASEGTQTTVQSVNEGSNGTVCATAREDRAAIRGK